MAQRLILYLDAPTRARHEAGRHGFLGRLAATVGAQGWRVTVRDSTPAERQRAPGREGYALYHMEQPTHDRALTFRQAYLGAFWRIEKTAERWGWPIAQARFAAGRGDPAVAGRFAARLLARSWPDPPRLGRDGFILMPLQGRLREHRSFQAMSPLAMIETVLAHSPLPVRATLHPRESYGPEDLAALDALMQGHARLTVQKGGTAALLPRCDWVATQNSSVAFHGYLLRKPALLFAGIDFHHIAASVPRDGLAAALTAPGDARPDFAGYLHWFLQQRAINAGRPDAGSRILTALRGHGWPI